MDIRITVLVDNTATQPDVLTEHGLSLWIEYDTKCILWDTGQSDILLSNAKKLGIDLAQTDIIALSHGHYDHTGGLPAVTAVTRNAVVYIHPAAITPRYSRKESIRPVGMPSAAIQSLDTRPIEWVKSWTQICQGVFVTGSIPRYNIFEDTGGAFFLDSDCRIQDTLPDDQALILESVKGVMVILGCAHSGTVNTLDYISRKTGQNKIYAVAGGMHLGNSTKERLDRTIEAFRRYDVKKIIPLHCTGRDASLYLQDTLSDRIIQFPTTPYLEI